MIWDLIVSLITGPVSTLRSYGQLPLSWSYGVINYSYGLKPIAYRPGYFATW